MERVTERDWRELFAVENLEPNLNLLPIACHCGSGNCAAAKKFRCTCRCGHKNHGSKFKDGLARLDEIQSEAQQVD
ncbi:MAG: hypothetical protein ABSF82_02295 [Candidatus Bathyarchaeia archaeon]